VDLSGGNKMYIIGTSTLSEMILDFLDILDIKVEGFFDDYRKEEKFKGHRVIGGCQELIDNSEKYIESKFWQRKNLEIYKRKRTFIV
jgi:hypothetical protein